MNRKTTTARVRGHGSWFSLAAGVVALGCSGAPAALSSVGTGSGRADDTSTIVLALTTVPGDVRCVRVLVKGAQTVDRLFDVTPNEGATLPVVGLPLGTVTVYEETFDSACSGVGPNTPPTWVSGAPVTLTLVSGRQTAVTIVLQRPSSLQVTNDYQGSVGTLTLLPNVADFGEVPVGSQSARPTRFQVVNATGAGVPIVMSVGGANPDDFSPLQTTCPVAAGSVLNSGASCTMDFFFAPKAAGLRTATLTMATGLTALLSGTGVVTTATLVPMTDDFGSVPVNGTSTPPRRFTLINGSAAAVQINMSMAGPHPADFIFLSSTCPANGSFLSPSAACAVDIFFGPKAAGPRSATLIMGAGLTAALTGFALSTPVLSPPSADFGSVPVDGTSTPPVRFTVINGAATPFTMAMAITGANAADFIPLQSTCPANGAALAGGASCTIDLFFGPKALGPRAATLTMGAGLSAALTGTAVTPPGLSLAPLTKDLGSVAVGSMSTPVPFTATNNSASAVAISSLTIDGADKAEFRLALGTCSGSIPAGASCTFSITFRPSSAGIKDATVTMTAGTLTATSTLAGLGVAAAALTIAPPTKDFGSLAIGSVSATAPFTVTNNGASTVAISSLTIDGADKAEFRLALGTCSGSIPAGASCTFSSTFRPSTVGARSATVSLAAGSSTVSASLSGTGLPSITNLVVKDTALGGDQIPNNTQWSVQPALQTNLAAFGDRSFTIEAIGGSVLVGKPWIRTAADSKAFTGEPLATFTLGGTGVYLLIDDRHNVGGRPPWLSDVTWINQGFDVLISQAPGSTFHYNVWRKSFPSGATVALPHIGSAIAPGYMVVVE